MIYEISVLGFNEDYAVNDYDNLIATFYTLEEAEWFLFHYPFPVPDKKDTFHAIAVLEIHKNNGEFVERLSEMELS